MSIDLCICKPILDSHMYVDQHHYAMFIVHGMSGSYYQGSYRD